MSDIRLVQGPEMREALRKRADLDVYRYQLNTPAFVITLIVGVALLLLGGVLWWQSQLATASWVATFVLITIGGLGAWAWAGYWYVFVETHFLAVSPERFFIGRRDRMWSIDWELLDAETLGFEEMTARSTKGELDMEVAGQAIYVHLFNAFVHLEDLQGLIFQLLQSLKDRETEPEEERDDEPTESESG